MSFINLIMSIYYVLALLKSSNSDKYFINTNGTTIIGKKLSTVFENKPYVAFWKIPYAEPPVGKLRFKPPKLTSWFGQSTYDYSVSYVNTCTYGFTEDCLYLSIFMPANTQTLYHPVLVWIHENSNSHGPDFFIDENVLVVTISFRTSIFGFLNTGDDFSLGNMGAKDILTAVKWIRDNIIYFNGDINRVTLFGSETTASIVASMLVTSAGEDLFTRVIVQSGSALTPADYRSYSLEICKKLYRNLKGASDTFNRTNLYEILSIESVDKLITVSQDLFDSSEVRDDQRLINSFGPTVEISRKGAFMNKFPLDVYKRKISNNAVELMIGYTNLDSLHKLDGFVKNKKLLKYLNYNFQYLLPFKGRKDEFESKRYKKIRRKVMEFYFLNGTIGDHSLRRYAKYVSDQVIYPLLRQARLHAEVSRNDVYLYRFAHQGSFNVVWNTLFGDLKLSGATAGDEICYQFKCKCLSEAYNTTEVLHERLVIKKIARLLANFAKYGNPTPKSNDYILGDLQWKPLDPHNGMKALNIRRTLKMINAPELKRIEFWDQLKEEFFLDSVY